MASPGRWCGVLPVSGHYRPELIRQIGERLAGMSIYGGHGAAEQGNMKVAGLALRAELARVKAARARIEEAPGQEHKCYGFFYGDAQVWEDVFRVPRARPGK